MSPPVMCSAPPIEADEPKIKPPPLIVTKPECSMIAPPSPDDEFTMELLRVIRTVPASIPTPPPYCADEQLIID
eukprot:1823032-Prymnesium_polylepis.1